jgi:hypothetical protein
MSPFMSYPTTGYCPSPVRICACGEPTGSTLYARCQDCRDADLILADAARIVAERELDLFGDNPEGMEEPYQIRASLGI